MYDDKQWLYVFLLLLGYLCVYSVCGVCLNIYDTRKVCRLLFYFISFHFVLFYYIYIFIAIALDESIFLDVLHFPMKNIKSRDLEAMPMGGTTSKPASDVVCLLLLP